MFRKEASDASNEPHFLLNESGDTEVEYVPTQFHNSLGRLQVGSFTHNMVREPKSNFYKKFEFYFSFIGRYIFCKPLIFFGSVSE